MQTLIGHTDVTNFFDAVVAHDRLSHAYGFVGPEHVGKETYVKQLAAKLLLTTPETLLVHPDFFLVDRLRDEKTNKRSQHIDVDQIRDLTSVLRRSAVRGGYTIAVVTDAGHMNSYAANALLKTLEEPKSRAILFLLTEDKDQVPATIQSRCQWVYFSPVKETALAQALQNRGVEAGVANTLAHVSRGLPGQALGWVTDTESYSEYEREIEQFWTMLGKPLYEKMAITEHISSNKDEHRETKDELWKTFSLWELLIRDILCTTVAPLAGKSLSSRVPHWSRRQWLGATQAIRDARAQIGSNVQPRLLVEHILLALP